MKLVKILFRTTPELKQRLLEMADRRGLSLSEMVRLILTKAIDAR